MTKKIFFSILFFSLFGYISKAQEMFTLTQEIAVKLSEMPLKCIKTQYPNKTAHVINNEKDAVLTPQQLHPAFYGCFDWHSSVHGHWMLVRLLKMFTDLPNKKEIEKSLSNTFLPEKMTAEAEYFTNYDVASVFERTYGWAWLLKLDEELFTWNSAQAREWHKNLQPLTQQILKLWKAYLPKQTYPNRTGVHPNSAFALSFALDWARAVGDKEFEKQLTEKAEYFYLNDVKTPANLEPDGSDFFSPSLQIAELMQKTLDKKEFLKWFGRFYTPQGIARISEIPVVSDLSDYYTVHLLGLSLSRAWCMRSIAGSLHDKQKQRFEQTADKLLNNALPLVFDGNYGGDHWLASFAVYALDKTRK